MLELTMYQMVVGNLKTYINKKISCTLKLEAHTLMNS